uniref:Envelope glycoprotein K n=1 Tax=Human herpesvirus 1 TaxID=10298 RepID=A0A2Z4HAW9_HHV1|nr:UL53 [Human alphaherpesvirus 1]
MLAVRSLQHLSTVVLITAYGLVLVWYTVFGASPLHRCIYAVRPTGTNNDTALVWMKMNQTLLFLGAPTHPPNGGWRNHAHICYANLIAGRVVPFQVPPDAMNRRIMNVHEAVNCLETLWYTRVRLVVVGWFLYLAFVALHQRRCMFGVVSPAHKMVAPATYLLNYAGRIVSSVFLQYPYTKITRLLCELSVQRQNLVQLFETDPVTFLYHRPAIGVIVGCELMLRFVAVGLIVGTAFISRGACAITYPLFLTITTWCFVSTIGLTELYCILRRGPAPKNADKAAALGRSKGLSGVCGRCCSIILSGIAVRLCYIAVVAGVVLVALHYEQEIQRRLFDV